MPLFILWKKLKGSCPMKLSDLREPCRQAVANTHGHVNPGLALARCGGPALCRHCLLELMAPLVLRATNDGQTHAVGCHTWGPRHYECALGHIKRLEETISLIDGLENGGG